MGGITIHRVQGTYRLPADAARRTVLRSRLDRAIGTSLRTASDAWTARLPEVTSDEVWLIRRLSTSLTLDGASAATTGGVAAAMSEGLHGAIRAALADGPDGVDVIRLPDRAAWVAMFVVAVVDGSAWDRWELRPFSSLRHLPTERAIVEAILREAPSDRASVVARLHSTGDLRGVTGRLPPSEAHAIASALVPAGPTPTAAARSLATALTPLLGPAGGDGPRGWAAVVCLLGAALDRGIELPPGAADVARAIVALRAIAAEHGPEEVAAIVAAAARGADPRPPDRTGVSLDPDSARLLTRLADGDERWLDALHGAVGDAPARAGSGADARSFTPFGGLLLLWPRFIEAWARVTVPADVDPGLLPTIRMQVAAAMLGPECQPALLRDPVLARLCGLDAPPVPSQLDAAAASLTSFELWDPGTPSAADHDGRPDDEDDRAIARFATAVLRAFAMRLPGFGDSSPGHLRRNFLETPATLRFDGEPWTATVTGPPLQVVLRIAGLTHLDYRLPWHPAAAVAVDLAWS